MKRFWKNKLITIWIACLAILANALVPSIASALAARDGNAPSWAEICSTPIAGLAAKKVGTSVALKLPGKIDTHTAKHCPFCLPHAGNFALAPAALPCCAVAAGHDAFPPLYYQAPSLLHSWVTANPRGPPQFS
ncbi:DUF2946 domain-containing protein [Undibacterium sp.]|uniref:DUF2946 domain-containing protein n=1 Tax=Undibacterium sp. TaxID=1914977 RepID=UPI0025D5F17D|nr:DUF2946 domain-containing protein [Undibacterium sp.]